MAKKARRTTQGRFKDIQTFKRGAWAGHQAAGEGGEVADRHQRDNVALRTCAVQSTVCWARHNGCFSSWPTTFTVRMIATSSTS
jgi:hypothetical protein